MSKSKKPTTTPAVDTVPDTLSFQPAPAEQPVATTEVPATGEVVGLSPDEIREAAEVKEFVCKGRSVAIADTLGNSNIESMAIMLLMRANRHGLGIEWTEVHATKLPPAIKVFHRALIDALEAIEYSKPPMMWKRVRQKAVALFNEAQKKANEAAGIVEPEEAESTREKIRRLCEDDIQKLYSRIYKAARSNETDVDIDIMGLMPMLVDMAESIGFNLAIPELKGN